MQVTITLPMILLAALSLIGGGSAVGALIYAGLFARYLRPSVLSVISDHEKNTDTVALRDAAIRKVLDDHVQRGDGLIRKPLDTAIKELSATLTDGLAEMREQIAELKGMVSGRTSQSPLRSPTPPHGVQHR